MREPEKLVPRIYNEYFPGAAIRIQGCVCSVQCAVCYAMLCYADVMLTITLQPFNAIAEQTRDTSGP